MGATGLCCLHCYPFLVIDQVTTIIIFCLDPLRICDKSSIQTFTPHCESYYFSRMAMHDRPLNKSFQ